MKFNRKQFFAAYRDAFGPIPGQLQVDGLEFLLGKIEQDRKWESLPQVAYFLATVRHETGVSRKDIDQTFQPIKELRERAGTKKRANQDRYWLSGYYGRGYTQLTWKKNYEKFGIASTPDKALEPDTAYMVAARGMREGKFTKYKLSDFINGQVDYISARKVVNGLDKAKHIAAIAEKFERILRSSSVTDSVTEPKVEEPKLEEPKAEQPTQPGPAEPAQDIRAIPPLPVKVPDWAKKILKWGASLNLGGLGVSFATLQNNPEALMAVLNILKWGFIALGVVAGVVVIGAIVTGMWNAKLANDLNVARLQNYADPETDNIDFSGWKAAPDKTEVKL